VEKFYNITHVFTRNHKNISIANTEHWNISYDKHSKKNNNIHISRIVPNAFDNSYDPKIPSSLHCWDNITTIKQWETFPIYIQWVLFYKTIETPQFLGLFLFVQLQLLIVSSLVLLLYTSNFYYIFING